MQHCKSQNLRSVECYFEPISKCSITDALINTSISDIHVVEHKSRYSKIYTDIKFEDRLIFEAEGKLREDIFILLSNDWSPLSKSYSAISK